ncbi:AAA family ATPase [Flavobacterium plurextorum]|uniref:AAA family ATPase n=1 Tax=Flavobacterium TaxID=237 RepID=UPI00214D150A|nr:MULTISPECIES: AAA family ATPase [Flavobacterium]UUW09576.1 AAA family ATPase [Flavobacterium plurextorum]
MKISKLHIDQFRHLENLEFDFTYPEDFHIEEKRGKPLDKICFIGQSATGKTGLLDFIYKCNLNALNALLIGGKLFSRLESFMSNMNGEVEFIIKNEKYRQKKDCIYYKGVEYKHTPKISGLTNELISSSDKKDVVFFKANLISDKNLEIFTKSPIDLIEKHGSQLSEIEIDFQSREKYGILFDDNANLEIWLFLLMEILNYRKDFTQKISELIHGIKTGSEEYLKLGSKVQKWQQENPNKLQSFAEKINPILEKLNLEVDLVNTEYSIPIKNKKTEEIISIENTSTGTKGLLLSLFPLFQLNTIDSIILIDEPERSLYPDMQMDLMDTYQKLAPDAQFIIATHSPFVAASFEPDERFILYFDNEGKVAVRRGSSPIGDDPNDMLKNDFGVNYYNKHGEEAYQKYISLKQEMATETDPKRKKELLLEIVKLGDTYNF